MSPPPMMAEKEGVDPVYMRTQADYNFSMGEAYALDGQRQKAIESFKATLIYDPESALVRLRLATEYMKSGFLSEAVAQAEEAVAKSPKNVEGRLLLGGLYSTMKVYDKAIVQYQEVLKLDPQNNEAPLYLGAVWSEQKHYDKAIHAFENLAKNPEYNTPHMAWYYVGRVYLDKKDASSDKNAEKAFLKALSIKPDHVDSVMALASVYNQQKSETKAMDVLVKWQRDQGPSPRVAEVLAQYYLDKEKYDDAYEQFEVLESTGDDPLSVKMKMALILIDKKMYDRAAVKLEEILKEAPDSDKVRYYLAAVYEESKKDDKAVYHFKAIPADSQYYEEGLIHAAYILKNRGQMDDALKLVEEGLSKKKDFPQLYAMQASLLDEKGDYKRASQNLEEALVKFPKNAQLRFYYGTINDRLGNKARVVEEMRKVLEIDPNHVQGLNYLAFTWAEEGKNLEEAEQLARRANKIDPKDGYILDTLGWVLYKLDRYRDAVVALEAAQKAQPAVAVIAEHLGDAYMKTAMTDKAIRMYRKALEFETDAVKVKAIQLKISNLDGQKLPSYEEARKPAAVSK